MSIISSRGVNNMSEVHIGNMGWGVMEEGGWRKGPWTAEEDRLLIEYVKLHGEGRWNSVSRLAGLRRNGKSCRLRWVNYLRPDLKRGQITPHEESIIVELHARWGNRWSTIARSLPGRTDNEIKNYWRTHFKKKQPKTSSSEIEKSKTRFLRKQQFQQQQQYQYQQLQQQQQQELQNLEQQFTTLDMNYKIISLLADTENKAITTTNLPEGRPENNYTNILCQNTSEEQGVLYSMLNSDTSTSEASSDHQDLLWDGFWNMDDVQGKLVGMHDFATSFC